MDSLEGSACPPIRQPQLEAGQDLGTPCWVALGKLCPAGDVCLSIHLSVCLLVHPTSALLSPREVQTRSQLCGHVLAGWARMGQTW